MTEACQSRGLVDRHFRGTIAPRQEAQLRAHLDTCASCRQHYERYLLLARFDRSIASAKGRLARGLGLAPRRRTWSRPAVVVMGLAAALVVLSFWPVARPAYVARGRAIGDADRVRHATVESDVALYVYRIAPGGAPQRVERGVIGSRDELAFAYLNRSGWSRLLVYARDEAGRIYWYHPGWTDSTTAPVAVQIATGRHELPEAIAQPLRSGRLEIHAVFTNELVRVQEIEQGKGPAQAMKLKISLQVIDQDVDPLASGARREEEWP